MENVNVDPQDRFQDICSLVKSLNQFYHSNPNHNQNNPPNHNNINMNEDEIKQPLIELNDSKQEPLPLEPGQETNPHSIIDEKNEKQDEIMNQEHLKNLRYSNKGTYPGRKWKKTNDLNLNEDSQPVPPPPQPDINTNQSLCSESPNSGLSMVDAYAQHMDEIKQNDNELPNNNIKIPKLQNNKNKEDV